MSAIHPPYWNQSEPLIKRVMRGISVQRVTALYGRMYLVTHNQKVMGYRPGTLVLIILKWTAENEMIKRQRV